MVRGSLFGLLTDMKQESAGKTKRGTKSKATRSSKISTSASKSSARGSKAKQIYEWIIFYEDSQFSSDDGDPWQAPRQGVQIIAQKDDFLGYVLVHGKDYFYFEPDRGGWSTCDTFGMYDHLVRADRQCLLFGRMLCDKTFNDLFHRVKAELGEKQGWSAKELRDGKVPA